MEKMTIFIICALWLQVCFGQIENERAQEFLSRYDSTVSEIATHSSEASWAYYTNITDYNLEVSTNWSLKYSEFSNAMAKNASLFNLNAITNNTIKRQLMMIMDIGISALNDTAKLKKISELEAEMTGIYSTGKVCNVPGESGCVPLDPDLTDILTTSRDYEKLKAVWAGWRDASGRKMKKQYEEFVNLLNEAIRFGGKYDDAGEYYRSWYEEATFEQDVRAIYEELRPLYEELHAYVRMKLKEHYGDKYFPATGHIPAHLFGNMWAQQWNNIYDILEPYPGKGRTDLTQKMKELNYNITHMYRVAEDFFVSLGLDPMPPEFWERSMLEKPADRDVVCHASAWDFTNGTDFRIKQCTTVTEDQLNTVHHEMGHVVYFMEYRHQPVLFRGGANPGFHEGVADITTLSFLTPEHLQKIGLLDELPKDSEGDINFLFSMALEKVAFLPFGYLIDQWRWSVFRGDTTPDEYNSEWWKLRCGYQGISPPVVRTQDDFDPGAKYHIPGNTPYIRYFVSFVAQFQWHKALCSISNYTGPLHRCDIYENKQAGQRLRDMLRMGSSEKWTEAMHTITEGTSAETRKLSAGPLLEYFDPLRQALRNLTKDEQTKQGWGDACPTITQLSAGSQHKYCLAVLLMTIMAIILS